MNLSKTKKLFQTLESKLYKPIYHLYHHINTKKILKSIESQKGKTDPRLIHLSNEYARDVLGWKGYASWLYVYSAVAENFKEGWIPDNYYKIVVIPYIKGQTSFDHRLLNFKYFKSELIPDIVYFANGLWLSKKGEVLPGRKIKEIIFENTDTVVYKTDDSEQGKGIFPFNKSTFDLNYIQSLGNGVIQNYVMQHPFFGELMHSSVATLRITTYLDNTGNLSVRSCYLRIGRKSDSHVKSDTHIRVPVNPESGELAEHGYLTSWITVDRHPDTNVEFANKRIPNFDQCLTTALELHKQMPLDRCIGWDMTVDKDHCVQVMEWNSGHNDIKFSEATQGPCFSGFGWEKLWSTSIPFH